MSTQASTSLEHTPSVSKQKLLQSKSYVWWNFSQTSLNELECCQKQCKCCCWWTTKSNSSLHLFNNWYLDSTVDAHRRGFMSFGVIRPNWRASSWIGVKKFRLYYGHRCLAGKRLVRAMQRMQFRAKSVKNDLKPMDFLKCNFYFETEGVTNSAKSSNEIDDYQGYHTSILLLFSNMSEHTVAVPSPARE